MSDPSTTDKIIDATEEKIYRLYRERMIQEDNLINHRMMWMVLSQAFMLALWGGFFKEFEKVFTFKAIIVLWVISVFGGIFAFGSKMAINAAQDEINELKEIICFFTPDRQRRRMILAFLSLIG